MLARHIAVAALAAGLWVVSPALIAQDKAAAAKPAPVNAAATLDQLLEQTKNARALEAQQNQARINKFAAEREQQSRLLAEARGEKAAQEARATALGLKFDENERKLTDLQAQLDLKAGNLGEMFGVVRQIAGDAAAVTGNSVISTQYPDRSEFLSLIAQSKALPSIDDLERLWFEMQREMTETGKVAKYQAIVIKPDGSESEQTITRVGPFTAVSDGKFMNYLPGDKKLTELTVQPASRFRSRASDLEDADPGEYVEMAIDPTRGSLLAILVQAPSFLDQVNSGGLVGHVILVLGLFGFIIAADRFRVLTELEKKVVAQRANIGHPTEDNPLGRVLAVYHKDPNVDHETLELRLDEAVLREVPALEHRLGWLKILAAVAPLLGLLGTVTGMILTFQQITLFGTGDPKLMADGISQALVTTVEGLVVAIPMVLLHSWLAGKSKSMIQTLEEESAGLIAENAEKRRA